MADVPSWLRARARTVAALNGIALLLALAVQFIDVDELLPLAAMYGSAALLGLDAAAVGVRKRAGEGPSIRNLAPGGWAVFAAMFWIVAVPAYFLGARRASRRADGAPREELTWGSWVAIGGFATLGLCLAAVALSR